MYAFHGRGPARETAAGRAVDLDDRSLDEDARAERHDDGGEALAGRGLHDRRPEREPRRTQPSSRARQAGGAMTRAGERLDLHRNAVAYRVGAARRAWRAPPTESPRSRSTMSARSVLHPRLCRLCASAPEAGTSFVASRAGDGIA